MSQEFSFGTKKKTFPDTYFLDIFVPYIFRELQSYIDLLDHKLPLINIQALSHSICVAFLFNEARPSDKKFVIHFGTG